MTPTFDTIGEALKELEENLCFIPSQDLQDVIRRLQVILYRMKLRYLDQKGAG